MHVTANAMNSLEPAPNGEKNKLHNAENRKYVESIVRLF